MSRLICQFYSKALKRDIEFHVLLPFDSMTPAAMRRAYPVCYLLHGGANDCTVIEKYTSVERYAIENGIVAVTFSAENKYYRHLTSVVETHPSGRLVIDEDFPDFILRELPEFLASFLPVSTDSAHSFIAGLSMGGYGALVNTLLAPDRFRAAGVFSGLVFERRLCFLSPMERAALPEDQLAQFILPELRELIASATASHARLPDYYIANGTLDITEFLPLVADMLKDAGAEVRYDCSLPYAHDWAFWDIQLSRFFSWIRTRYFDERGD